MAALSSRTSALSPTVTANVESSDLTKICIFETPLAGSHTL